MKTNTPFLEEGNKFFKSTVGMTDSGKLLQKTIPTIDKTKEPVRQLKEIKKKIPKEVTAFKKKIEDAFNVIDETIKDLTEQYSGKIENLGDMLKDYQSFKNNFRYKINDIINKSDYSEIDSIESDYNKARINI